jgi:hypothetical protein
MIYFNPFNQSDELMKNNYEWNNKIMQFTWLLDKNWKEIYFDDLVKAPSWEIFLVIWYEEEMRIALKQKDTIYNFNVPLYEVVGNLHSNA